MKKKVYNRKNNKNLKYEYDWDYDDNVEDTWTKKNHTMQPKKVSLFLKLKKCGNHYKMH